MLRWLEKTVSVSDLKPYERNPRKISKEAFERLKRDITGNGYHQRILATQDLRVIGGHQRIKALAELGIKEIPVLVPSEEISDEQFREMLVKDNLQFGEFDYDILTEDYELEELVDFGMNEKELAGFYKENNEGLTDPDETPPIPDVPLSEEGDVWVLGNHRLRCGNSTVATDVDALLNGIKPHLMVTDPPYGVNYDPDWRNRADRANGKPIGGRAVGTVSNDDRSDWQEAWSLFPGDVAYCWHADRHASNTQLAFEACGFELRAQIIWAKSHFSISRGHYHIQHEPCFYMVRKKAGSNGHWSGDRTQSTLWTIDKPQKNDTGHSTQKPVECMKRPMENNSSPGQVVYEPFSGSGTSIIAAEMIGRHCYAMEINPAYVDMGVARWMKFTGKEAIHEASGKNFMQLTEERRKAA